MAGEYELVCDLSNGAISNDLVFKVTPLFDAIYLTNGYRYGDSYYRKRIGTAPKISNSTHINNLE